MKHNRLKLETDIYSTVICFGGRQIIRKSLERFKGNKEITGASRPIGNVRAAEIERQDLLLIIVL
jgi:hypothetical protein